LGKRTNEKKRGFQKRGTKRCDNKERQKEETEERLYSKKENFLQSSMDLKEMGGFHNKGNRKEGSVRIRKSQRDGSLVEKEEKTQE